MRQSASSACFWSGPGFAEGIMASGHAYRTNRSNTWPHRPGSAERQITLANGEPSTHGAFQFPWRTGRQGATRLFSHALRACAQGARCRSTGPKHLAPASPGAPRPGSRRRLERRRSRPVRPSAGVARPGRRRHQAGASPLNLPCAMKRERGPEAVGFREARSRRRLQAPCRNPDPAAVRRSPWNKGRSRRAGAPAAARRRGHGAVGRDPVRRVRAGS